MKKFFFLLIVLVACNSKESIKLKDLDVEDRDFYINQSKKQCVTDTKKNFFNFETDSNNSLRNFPRGYRWKFIYKDDDNSRTTYYHLWKFENKAMYVIQSSPLNENNKFIKITSETNSKMIQALRTSLCDNTDKSISFVNANPPQYKITKLDPRNTDTKFKRTSTYQFKSTLPIFLGQLHLTVDQRIVDNNESDVKDPDAKTHKTAVSTDKDAKFAFETFQEYIGAEYCVPDDSGEFSLPYKLVCTSNDVDGGGPAGWPNPGDDLEIEAD